MFRWRKIGRSVKQTQSAQDAAKALSLECRAEMDILNDPGYELDRVKHATAEHDKCHAPATCGCQYHGKPDVLSVADFEKEIGANG